MFKIEEIFMRDGERERERERERDEDKTMSKKNFGHVEENVMLRIIFVIGRKMRLHLNSSFTVTSILRPFVLF